MPDSARTHGQRMKRLDALMAAIAGWWIQLDTAGSKTICVNASKLNAVLRELQRLRIYEQVEAQRRSIDDDDFEIDNSELLDAIIPGVLRTSDGYGVEVLQDDTIRIFEMSSHGQSDVRKAESWLDIAGATLLPDASGWQPGPPTEIGKLCIVDHNGFERGFYGGLVKESASDTCVVVGQTNLPKKHIDRHFIIPDPPATKPEPIPKRFLCRNRCDNKDALGAWCRHSGSCNEYASLVCCESGVHISLTEDEFRSQYEIIRAID